MQLNKRTVQNNSSDSKVISVDPLLWYMLILAGKVCSKML